MDIDKLFEVFETDFGDSGPTAQASPQKRKREEDAEATLPTPKIPHLEDAEATLPTPKIPHLEDADGQPQNSEDLFKFPQEINRATKLKLMSTDVCKHEVVVPQGMGYAELPKTISNAAKTYPFELDPFQREALLCLEANQSVLVSAHTSAGKTVIAEYSIAMCLRRTQKVIYTTPIKALSNQKFREFQEEFTKIFGNEAVGLMTGDVTTNPKASCLVMTTEILRNMLLKGSDILDGVAWVIYDEVHYMRDKERGLVWEESMILMPDSVRFIFLSATIPNAMQFARWVSWIHYQPIHVVSTSYRPVPLEFSLFPKNTKQLFRVLDHEGNFSEENFQWAMNSFADNKEIDHTKKENACFQLVSLVKEQDLVPTIVFVFSKKGCEAGAQDLVALDFNNATEKKKVEEIFEAAIDVLSDDDKKLKEVQSILPFLRRGIGTHHAGMLPLVREVVEVLFGSGLIKVLFATETFSMGLNMPARSVIFNGLRKYDGGNFRWLTAGEFVQMSGRAGRRGLDAKGTVMVTVSDKIPQDTIKGLIKGYSEPLKSAYRLSNHTILSLLQRREISCVSIISRTFLQFQKWGNKDNLITQYNDLKEQLVPMTPREIKYYLKREDIYNQTRDIYKKMTRVMLSPKYCQRVLVPGRMVKILTKEGKDFKWCIVCSCDKIEDNNSNARKVWGVFRCTVIAEVVTPKFDVDKLHKAQPATEAARKLGGTTFMKLLARMGDIQLVHSYISPLPATHCSRMLRYNVHGKPEYYEPVPEALQKFRESWRKGQSDLINDPRTQCGIKSTRIKEFKKQIEECEAKLKNLKEPKTSLFQSEGYKSLKQRYKRRVPVEEKMKQLSLQLEDTTLLKELEHRTALLRKLGFLSNDDLTQMKGTVACEIVAADEILLTELLFSGHFSNLDIHQTSALLSCFVCQEKSDEDDPKTSAPVSKEKEELQQLFSETLAVASKLAHVAQECGLELQESEYIQAFQPHMMEVVFLWSKGQSLANVLATTSVQVGSIVRCLRQLEDLLQQMVKASVVMGNIQLQEKFQQCATSLRRDIVFASSIYTD